MDLSLIFSFFFNLVCYQGLEKARSAKLKQLQPFLPWVGGHVVIVDCADGVEKRSESSRCNVLEAELCSQIVASLARLGGLDIAVVTFYRAQVDLLRSKIADQKLEMGEHLQVDTVDAFQGREADVVVISTVRTGSHVGFLSEPRRINVALTRAKTLLIVLGRIETIKRDPLLRAWYSHCQKNRVQEMKARDVLKK